MLKSKKIREIKFPIFKDRRGNLSFFESESLIPFKINRVFWIYDVPSGEVRGSHANKNLEEVIIALSGSFKIVVRDLKNKEIEFQLSHPSIGLYIPKLTWRGIRDFSTNATCLIIASTPYNEKDYVRSFNNFKKMVNERE
jgi:dTDP-4-dehydrorhamnose 3,5-epimerase-like enzyme